jgi:hypothetical protein
MEQIIEAIKADPLRVFGAFMVIMAVLSCSRDVVDQVKAHFRYESKNDSEWARQFDKWGK